MTTEIERKEEIESSITAIIELLQGDDMNESYGDMLSEVEEEEYKAVQQFFADFDSSWKTHIGPIIDAILDRRLKAERVQEYSLLDASPKGGQADADMKPAPTTTGTQTQMQVQRTVPETQEQNDLAPPPTPKQLLMLTVRYHVPQNVIDKLNKWTAMRLIAELTERSNV